MPGKLCAGKAADVENVWETLRREAANAWSTEEPTLRHLVHDVILSRETPAAALGARLARRLAREDMPRASMEPLLTGVFEAHPHIVHAAVARSAGDVRAGSRVLLAAGATAVFQRLPCSNHLPRLPPAVERRPPLARALFSKRRQRGLRRGHPPRRPHRLRYSVGSRHLVRRRRNGDHRGRCLHPP